MPASRSAHVGDQVVDDALGGGAALIGQPPLGLGAIALDDDPPQRQRAEHDERRQRHRRDRHRRPVAADEARDPLAHGVAVRGHQLAGLEPAQLLGQRLRGRVARGRLVGHGPGDDRGEIGRRVGRALGQRLDLALDRRGDDVGGGLGGVGRGAGQQVVEHRAQAEHVGALVDRLAARLLGRHVRRRAHHRAGDGEDRLLRGGRRPGAVALGAGAGQRVGAVVVEILGQAPVDDDDLAEVAHQHVGRLEVAVDDALGVRVGDRVDRRGDRRQQRQALLERLGVGDRAVERPAADQLHRVERLARRPAPGLVDRHDRRVLEARGDQRLAAEPRAVLGIGVQQLLERDRPAEDAIGGRDDAAHAAARDLALGHVLPGVGDRQVVDGDHQLGPRVAAAGDGVLVRLDALGPARGRRAAVGRGRHRPLGGGRGDRRGERFWIAGRRIAGAHLLAMYRRCLRHSTSSAPGPSGRR